MKALWTVERVDAEHRKIKKRVSVFAVVAGTEAEALRKAQSATYHWRLDTSIKSTEWRVTREDDDLVKVRDFLR